jgi:hypothetical protein
VQALLSPKGPQFENGSLSGYFVISVGDRNLAMSSQARLSRSVLDLSHFLDPVHRLAVNGITLMIGAILDKLPKMRRL